MKTVDKAEVKTLAQGLMAAKELSMYIGNVVDAFEISELPSKSELQKMLHEANLQERWYIYHGFCAIAYRRGGVLYQDSVQRELQMLLFSIEACIESSMDATEDPKELRKILRWTNEDEHPKTRKKLIKKLAQSLLRAVPEADDGMLVWISDEGCLKDHVDFYDVLRAVNEESDKRASRYVESNEDPSALLSVVHMNASYDTKKRALRKALANTVQPEVIYSIIAHTSGNEDERRAWDKFVDNVDDDKRLWIAVDANYSESEDCAPRSKALKKLLSIDSGLESLFRVDRYRLRSTSFPYHEMEQAFMSVVEASLSSQELRSVYDHISKRNKNAAKKAYEKVMHACVRRLYELS